MEEFRIALKNEGIINAFSIDDYIALGGYKTLSKVFELSPYNVVLEIISSGLRGRGGGGFLAGLKEKNIVKNKCVMDVDDCIRYIVCNADEGEPGTFKDRVIMETDPHLLIEGMVIAAYAVGAEVGYIYIRGEYYNSIKLVKHALKQAYAKNFVGNNILYSGFSLDLEVMVGAGSYLCGEELTLLESIEGKRGYPRIKPPFPAEIGLFGKPTLVNNVETLTHIPFIMFNGAKQYRKIGPKNSPGTKIFTISGDIKNPGYFEVKMGTKLKTIIYDLAGGITKGKKLKAVLVGGAAGMFIPESLIDISMDFDSLKENGFVMGSGAIIVLDERRSIFRMLKSILDFFAEESCGKCIPCRVGTKQLSIMIDKLINETNLNVDSLLNSMSYNSDLMAKTSLCPLGQSPIMPISSAIKYFKNDLF